jgi:hypothetical protein
MDTAHHGLVRMTVLGLLPRLVEGALCPLCDNTLLVLIVGWSTGQSPIEVEAGGYCDRKGCDTFVLGGPDEP